MSAFVDLSFDGPCARLTLKRPDKLNALDRPMIDALLDGARAIEALPEARVAEASARISDAMSHAVTLDVPLVVDVASGPSWNDAHA